MAGQNGTSNKSLSIEDSIRAAYDEAEKDAGYNLETGESLDVSDDAEPKPEGDLEDSSTDGGAGSEDNKDPDSEGSGDGTDLSEGEGEDAKDPEPVIEPPSFLDAEEKADFEKLDPAGKALYDKMSRRRDLALQRYITKKNSEMKETFDQAITPYRRVDQALAPYMETFKMRKQDPVQAIESSLAWDRALDSDPLAALAQLSAIKGVSPRELYDFMEANPDFMKSMGGGSQGAHHSRNQGGQDPLLERIDQLEAKLQGRDQDTQYQTFLSQVRSMKTETGESLFPHWDTVRQELAMFVEYIGKQYPNADPVEIIKTAYDRAVRSNPQVAALMTSQQRAAELEAKKEKAKANLNRKKASSSLPTSRSGKLTPNSDKAPSTTIQDSILQAMEQLGVDLDTI